MARPYMKVVNDQVNTHAHVSYELNFKNLFSGKQ